MIYYSLWLAPLSRPPLKLIFWFVCCCQSVRLVWEVNFKSTFLWSCLACTPMWVMSNHHVIFVGQNWGIQSILLIDLHPTSYIPHPTSHILHPHIICIYTNTHNIHTPHTTSHDHVKHILKLHCWCPNPNNTYRIPHQPNHRYSQLNWWLGWLNPPWAASPTPATSTQRNLSRKLIITMTCICACYCCLYLLSTMWYSPRCILLHLHTACSSSIILSATKSLWTLTHPHLFHMTTINTNTKITSKWHWNRNVTIAEITNILAVASTKPARPPLVSASSTTRMTNHSGKYQKIIQEHYI